MSTFLSKFFILPRIFLVMMMYFIFQDGFGQEVRVHHRINWQPVQQEINGPGDTSRFITFPGSVCFNETYGSLPVYIESVQLSSPDDEMTGLSIQNPVYSSASVEMKGVGDVNKIGFSLVPEYNKGQQRNQSFASVSFLPIRKNPVTGIIEKLVSFDLCYKIEKRTGSQGKKEVRTYAEHSVLGSGTWFKMAIPSTGIYILQGKDLKAADPGLAGADPSTIQIFGNNGGMLPEANSTPRIDDLRELPVQIVTADPSKLNDNDYILFYAKGPDKWNYSASDKLFHHSNNLYSDVSYCFLTFGQATGKRVSSEPSTTDPPVVNVNKFNDYTVLEPAEINVIKTGKAWYSKDVFELTTTRDYSFTFQNLETSLPVSVTAIIAAHGTTTPTSFDLSVNGKRQSSVSISPVSTSYGAPYGYEGILKANVIPAGPTISINLNYHRPAGDGIGYMRSIELNAIRHLSFTGGQMAFRSVTGSAPGLVSKFNLTTGNQPVTVWDVSDPGAIKVVGTEQNGNQLTFTLHTDTVLEFTAFDGSAFYPVQSFTKIGNQDLHATGNPDMVIVAHPSFLDQAERLATYHQQHDGLNIFVTTPDKIYNEFSCGAQDISGIRDFVKMIYDRSSKASPRYLLMFGDASYDYKNRVPNNSNYVPSFETSTSLDPSNSVVTDDFFGILDNGEGEGSSGVLDIGVGRFPVQTPDQATSAVDKVIHYCSNTDTVKNSWRNMICFVAEDWDNGLHEQNADLINIPDTAYNEDKIYLGAYDRISTPGGLRYPAVNEAINQRMAKGALIMNYIGHGGVLGWAHARVLDIPGIRSWANFDNMPVFLTATCEFSYFDDPSWTSAGEEVFLNPHGGGIALLTTTRPTESGDNQSLVMGFYNNAFKKLNGNFPTLGDLIMDAKLYAGGSTGNANSRKFVLLGDPAIRMAYPGLNVVTTSINASDVTAGSDTLKALSTVTITGEIRDENGNLASNFNGTVFPTVYDKYSSITTTPLQGESPFHFHLRKNIIYKGQMAVTDGRFSFTFIVPKDIAYNFGTGKISYYARSAQQDANGYDETITVGGFNDRAPVDNEGPVVRLFMNDTNFVNGGITNQNPDLLAFLSDSSGINTVGNGIGHDLTATLDGNSQNLKILNDYYVTDLNTFKKGVITYPFFNLPDGPHTVKVKVWDVYNNSSEASIDFIVVSSADLAVQHVLNYPNPFNDQTTFSFQYNHPDTQIQVQIDIYSLSGQKVKTLRTPLYSTGFQVNTVNWDGSDDNGSKIGSGMYIYNIKLTLPDGSATQKSSKLVVIR